MKKVWLQTLMFFFFLSMSGIRAFAHCEIPCGIYDDTMRINMIKEHITTIEKSMKQISTLENETPLNYNQISRWIMNKDHHAGEIQEITSQYFMTQRIQLNTKQYAEKLTVLHQILVYSMKCKQTTDLGHVNKLRTLVNEFQALYFKDEKK